MRIYSQWKSSIQCYVCAELYLAFQAGLEDKKKHAGACPYIFSVSTDVVGCFGVICTLGEPFPNGSTVCGCVVHLPTLKAEQGKKRHIDFQGMAQELRFSWWPKSGRPSKDKGGKCTCVLLECKDQGWTPTNPHPLVQKLDSGWEWTEVFSDTSLPGPYLCLL